MKISFLKIVFALVFLLSPFIVSASSQMSGWAWSSNIGWISFNSANSTSGGGGPHSVTINDDGTLTGWAWSPNVGWIKFGGIMSFPANGAARIEAKVPSPTTSGTLTGWARVCSGTQYGDCRINSMRTIPVRNGYCGGDGTYASPNCYTMPSRGDGWNGFIELSGANHTINYTYNPSTGTGTFSGYAWGGNTVGWVNFDNVVSLAPVMSGTLTSSAPSCTIQANASSCQVNLSWNTINPEVTPSTVTSSYPNPNTVVFTGNSTVAFTTVIVPHPSRTFYLYNNGKSLVPTSPTGSGLTITSSCVFGTLWDPLVSKCMPTTQPIGEIRCNGSRLFCPSIIAQNSSATISWNSANTSSCAMSITENGITTNWNVTPNSSGSRSTGSLSSSKVYDLKCNGSTLDSVSVQVQVNGGWTDWSECSVDCGSDQYGNPGSKSRSCTNPAPENGGAQCSGDSTEPCNLQACTDTLCHVRAASNYGGQGPCTYPKKPIFIED